MTMHVALSVRFLLLALLAFVGHEIVAVCAETTTGSSSSSNVATSKHQRVEGAVQGIQDEWSRIRKKQRRRCSPLWLMKRNKSISDADEQMKPGFSKPASSFHNEISNLSEQQCYNPLRMYLSCMGIVSLWITTGTIFYSYCNQWPLAQSFFYAVDAGMSIGFCTRVHERKLLSKAFTIIYILLGASVVGGALALFIQDAVEGIAEPSVQEYQVLLEKEAFQRADVSRTGVLSFDEFQALLMNSSSSSKMPHIKLSQEDVQQLWNKFDRLKDGVIHFEEFVGTYRGIDRLVESLQRRSSTLNPIQRIWMSIRHRLQQAWHLEHRIYVVFVLWIALGVSWGMLDQGWDPITATHFAVSALATGGLTAPEVNAEGILPARPAIFCGVYCLLGIPLFALTLGHFARVLVSHHVAALEASALTRPLTQAEFDVAKHLTTQDSLVHLSDFVVLQLLRQGKLSVDAIKVLKQNFDLLDTDSSGTLTLEQATAAVRSNTN